MIGALKLYLRMVGMWRMVGTWRMVVASGAVAVGLVACVRAAKRERERRRGRGWGGAVLVGSVLTFDIL